LGWYCRYDPSVHAREVLVQEGGFIYHSNAYRDDLPQNLEEILAEGMDVLIVGQADLSLKMGLGYDPSNAEVGSGALRDYAEAGAYLGRDLDV